MMDGDDLERKLDIYHPTHKQDLLEALHKHSNPKKQIRHLRKFAASILLGPWDILRNLHVIRDQLQSLFKFAEQEDKKKDQTKHEIKRFQSMMRLMSDVDEKV